MIRRQIPSQTTFSAMNAHTHFYILLGSYFYSRFVVLLIYREHHEREYKENVGITNHLIILKTLLKKVGFLKLSGGS